MKISHFKNKEYWKQKLKSQIQRKHFKKQIFGQHYNFQTVKINNNKKYFNEEVKIMQIQKSNRLLLQKIKRIAERSKPRNILLRARTQAIQNQSLMQKSQTQEKLQNINTMNSKRQRYQSVESILEKTRLKKASPSQTKFSHNQQEESQKIILYKGRRRVEKQLFSFTIFVQKKTYTILAETAKTQQKIDIPVQNYKFLLKQELNSDHRNIFNFLKVCQNKRLQLKGTNKFQVNIIEKAQIQLPLINQRNILN